MNPHEVRSLSNQIKRDLVTLESEFRWLHGAAYGTRSYGGAGGRSTDHSDPTLSTLVDKEQARYRERLKLATNNLEKAQKLIAKALDLASERYRAKDVHGMHDPPRSLTPGDQKKLEQASSRRASRGEGFGES